jgi:4-amino-4-deoxy-L-arabinose transferase-like glycosyltransferase
MGKKFLYEWGNDPAQILAFARFPAILLTILTVILLYFFARRLLGSWWALLPAFLFALSPTILANGHYVTTDISAAFGILLATSAFLTYLQKSSRAEEGEKSENARESSSFVPDPAKPMAQNSNFLARKTSGNSGRALILAGLAFGIAQICKFSAFLLIPFFILMMGLWIIINGVRNHFGKSFSWKELFASAVKKYFGLLAIFSIGYLGWSKGRLRFI